MPLGINVQLEMGANSAVATREDAQLAWKVRQLAGGGMTIAAPASERSRQNSRSPRSPKKEGNLQRSVPSLDLPDEEEQPQQLVETLVTPQPRKLSMATFAPVCSICDVLLRHPGSSKCVRCVDLFSQILALEVQQRDVPPLLEHLRMIKGMRLAPNQLNLSHPETKMSFLHWFAWHGDADLCDWILKQRGTEKNPQNAMGKTPLHVAVERGQMDCVQVLLECEAVDAEATTLSGYTPLHLAALWGNVDIAEALLRQRKVEPDPVSAHGTPRELTKSAAVRRLLTNYGGGLLDGEDEDIHEEQEQAFQLQSSRQGLSMSGVLRRDTTPVVGELPGVLLAEAT